MRKGFTLIEVSVVLVIMALIVATVIGGRSLSEAAKIQRIITDAREHIMSTNIFKLEFGYFPGDFLHGFDTFANGSNGICGDNSTNHSGCNGDGNGLYYQPEGILAWTHLQLAEIADYRLPLYSTPGTGSRYYRPSPADQYQTWTKNHYNVPQWNDAPLMMVGCLSVTSLPTIPNGMAKMVTGCNLVPILEGQPMAGLIWLEQHLLSIRLPPSIKK